MNRGNTRNYFRKTDGRRVSGSLEGEGRTGSSPLSPSTPMAPRMFLSRPPQSKCPLVVLQLEGHTLSKGKRRGQRRMKERSLFPHTSVQTQTRPRASDSIKGRRELMKEDLGRCGETGLGVDQEPQNKHQMTVEMAMWTKKITPQPPPLFHTNLLFKDKRSFYSIKNQKL